MRRNIVVRSCRCGRLFTFLRIQLFAQNVYYLYLYCLFLWVEERL